MVLNNRKVVVNTIFWSFVFVLFFLAFGPNLRFGPDFRLSTKLINPDEPGFDPQDFQFDDYNDYRDLMFTLSKIFPVGTDKATIKNLLGKQHPQGRVVERPLEDGAGWTPPDSNRIKTKVSFEYPKLYSQLCFMGGSGKEDRFHFIFDENDKLLSFYLLNACGVMSDKKEE